jgi:hypothetical protein
MCMFCRSLFVLLSFFLTYPWSFVTQIFYNVQPSHGDDRTIFEVMTSTLPKRSLGSVASLLAATLRIWSHNSFVVEHVINDINCLPFRITWVHAGFQWGSCYSIFSFMCMFCRSLFVLLSFFLWSLLFVFLRFMDSDYLPLVSSSSSCTSNKRNWRWIPLFF